jgi:hypothetical protein
MFVSFVITAFAYLMIACAQTARKTTMHIACRAASSIGTPASFTSSSIEYELQIRHLGGTSMGDVIIRCICFPSLRTYGATRKDSNGDFNVYIDERLSEQKMRETLQHEIDHIEKNHFSDSVSAWEAEMNEDEEANQYGPLDLE